MGGKSKAKQPKAPDYKALAEQQAQLNNQQLQAQTEANRPNQVGPTGSLNWSQDPTTGQWTQTTSLDPRIQAIMDQQLGKMGELGNRQFSGPEMPTYDPESGQAYADKFTESLMARIRPQQGLDQEAMQTKLRLQGLQPGTQAYDRAYQNLLTSQGDVNAQATLQGQLAGGKEAREIYNTQLGGQQQGYSQAMQNYLLPYTEMGSQQGLVSGLNAGFSPQFQGFQGANAMQAPDVMGATQQQYAQQMQQYNAQQQAGGGKGGSIGGLVGGIAGSFLGPMGTAVGAKLGSYVGDKFAPGGP